MQIHLDMPETEAQPTLADLKAEYERAMHDMAEMHWMSANKATKAAHRAVLERAQARYQQALADWRLGCLEQRMSNPGCEGR